jgi:hypothetical protein
MGKKFNHFPNSRYNDEDDLEEDVPSDLEIQDDEQIVEEEEKEEINLIEDLNFHTEKIKKEYRHLLAKKGGNPDNWLETLTLTHEAPIDENLNIDDDIKRELEFYNVTTQNVMRGLIKLKEV